MFWKFSKLHKPLDFLFMVYSLKLQSTNQNTVAVRFISPLFMFTSETSETHWSNVRNFWKTSVEPQSPSKFFGSILDDFRNLQETSEICGRLRTTFGNLRLNLVNLRKTSDHLRESSEIFGCLVVNMGCLRKSSRLFWKTLCLLV